MRTICAMALLLGLLAGCAPGPAPTDASRAATCREMFARYDQALLFRPQALGVLQIPTQPPAISSIRSAESGILQHGCTTTPGEMPDLAALDLSAYARPGGGPVAARQYMQLAIVTDNASERALRDVAEGLGYPVRVKGAELLGRRVFIGPLTTRPDQDAALALARAMGFDAAYFLIRVP